jgi:hypothetical protein
LFPFAGDQVDIRVQSHPNALVALLAMDRALQLMRTGNDITKSDIIEALEACSNQKPNQYSHGYYRCIQPSNQLHHSLPVILLSNLEEECPDGMDQVDLVPKLYYSAPNAAHFKRCAYTESAQPVPVVQVRKHFPETWIWLVKRSE